MLHAIESVIFPLVADEAIYNLRHLRDIGMDGSLIWCRLVQKTSCTEFVQVNQGALILLSQNGLTCKEDSLVRDQEVVYVFTRPGTVDTTPQGPPVQNPPPCRPGISPLHGECCCRWAFE